MTERRAELNEKYIVHTVNLSELPAVFCEADSGRVLHSSEILELINFTAWWGGIPSDDDDGTWYTLELFDDRYCAGQWRVALDGWDTLCTLGVIYPDDVISFQPIRGPK